MYQDWPFFQSTMDLIEMILAKADMRIAQMYDEQLVHSPSQHALGALLRECFMHTVQAVLQAPLLPSLMCHLHCLPDSRLHRVESRMMVLRFSCHALECTGPDPSSGRIL